MRISIFGAGYVGLATAACFAEAGHSVLCLDIDAERIAGLSAGRLPIFEPGLAPLVASGLASGRLRFSAQAEEGVAHGEVLFIAVGTPPGEDGSADVSRVLEVAEAVGRHMQAPTILVAKSTVPVGTSARLRETVRRAQAARGVEIPFEVVSNPEFLKQGAAVQDCMRPDRVVVGADSPEAVEAMRQVYAPFLRNHDRMVVMDPRSAELAKYAANAMLATKISFMNEIANIAERVGADVEMVRQGIGSDPRIGWHFIYPGAGYGGSCFPKDVQALVRAAVDHGVEPRLLRAVEAVNQSQKGHLFELMLRHYGDAAALAGATIAVWGLAFKPGTDDLRQAPSRRLLEQLWEAGARVRAFDPKAADAARRLYGAREGLVLCEDEYDALEGADALAIVTEWKQFRSPDFARMRGALRHAVVFDGRNLFEPRLVEAAGLAYYGIGRGRSVAAAGGRA
jgi:UDPglucose 6-dehydrogenase